MRSAPIAFGVMTILAARELCAAPEDIGPYGVDISSVAIVAKDSVAVATDVYVPQSNDKVPIIAIRHAQTRTKETMVGWGKLLASHGYVVVSPNARNNVLTKLDDDSGDLVAAIDWAIGNSVVGPHVDSSKKAVAGITSGGSAAVAAASREQTIKAVVLWDTEKSTVAETLAANVSVPVLAYFSDANNCNGSGSGIATFQQVIGPRFGFKMAGSHFCDVENPSDNACAILCGGLADSGRFNRIARYTVAFLESYLKCDPTTMGYVNGAQATSDSTIQILTDTKSVVMPPPSCVVPVEDAGSSDAGAASADGGLAFVLDAGVVDVPKQNPPHAAPTEAAADDSGCSCSEVRNGEKRSLWAAAGFLAVAAAWIRRKRFNNGV